MRVTFLGQAGVVVASGGERLLIDPCLSDNRNALSNGFWAREIPIPVDAVDSRGACAVVCTHEHAYHWTSEHGHRRCSVVVEAEGKRLFHAGDTADWDGFAEAVGPVDVACVPVNGRGRGREEHGIVGNLDEHAAADHVGRLPARHALALHWDMFPGYPGDPALFRSLLEGTGVHVDTGPALTTFTV